MWWQRLWREVPQEPPATSSAVYLLGTSPDSSKLLTWQSEKVGRSSSHRRVPKFLSPSHQRRQDLVRDWRSLCTSSPCFYLFGIVSSKQFYGFKLGLKWVMITTTNATGQEFPTLNPMMNPLRIWDISKNGLTDSETIPDKMISSWSSLKVEILLHGLAKGKTWLMESPYRQELQLPDLLPLRRSQQQQLDRTLSLSINDKWKYNILKDYKIGNLILYHLPHW